MGRIEINLRKSSSPATLELPCPPSATYSTPDGSCLVALFTQDGNDPSMRVYHWVSFGSGHEGFAFELPIRSKQTPIISSLDKKEDVYLMWADKQSHACKSVAMIINGQMTGSQLRVKGKKVLSRRTFHNSILDCHSDVWTCFPVVSPVRRVAIRSNTPLRDRFVLFATASVSNFPFESYFQDTINRFEKITKKPTDSLLISILVQSDELLSVLSTLNDHDFWKQVSTFKAGGWMVDFFCSIPIHIAVARDNRFIPLKDGIWSPKAENALLGASIDQVADSLSFGWYESIFHSYMSTKVSPIDQFLGLQ